MPNPVKPIPDNFHSLTPNLVCRNAAQAIEFYKAVFGATELMRMPGPGGKIMHAELQIGDSRFFVNDSMGKSIPTGPEPGASNPMYLHLYVEDVDTIYNRAIKGGARVDMPLQDMFWGDRYGLPATSRHFYGQVGCALRTCKTQKNTFRTETNIEWMRSS